MTLAIIRDWLKTFGLAENYYTNRLDNKKEKSLGVYDRTISGSRPVMAIGGLQNSSYDMMPVSLLLHWNRDARETEEAKLWKALDNLEAVISHNEAALATWIPLEYTENLVYGEANCAFSPWTKELREMLKQDSIEKIEREQ